MLDEKENNLKLNKKEENILQLIEFIKVSMGVIFSCAISAALLKCSLDPFMCAIIGSISCTLLCILIIIYITFRQPNPERIDDHNDLVIDKHKDMFPYLEKEEIISFMKNNLILQTEDFLFDGELIEIKSDYRISYQQYMIYNIDNNDLGYKLIEKKDYDLTQLKDLVAWYHTYGKNEKFKIYNKLETSQKIAYIEKNSKMYNELCQKSRSDALSEKEHKFTDVFEEIKNNLIKAAISFVKEEDKIMLNRFNHIRKEEEKMIEKAKLEKRHLLEKKVENEIKLGEMLLK